VVKDLWVKTFLQYDGFESLLKQYPVTYFTLFTTTMSVELNDIIKFSCKPVQQFYGQYDIMRSEFQRFIQNDYTVIVLAETEVKKSASNQCLNEMHIPTFIDTPSPQVEGGSAIITEGSLSEGFELPYMQLSRCNRT
jgi:transcription-repair coupling factor (superfamily II helicase)